MDDIGSYTPGEDLGIPVTNDPTTGRSPESEHDPNCDHCVDNRWTVLLTFTGEWQRTRRLCADCAAKVMEWI